MRRFPILATIIVLAAVGTMVWLGFWQLQRAVWKEQLLARYAAAEGLPVLPAIPRAAKSDPESVAFRRVTLRCVAVASPQSPIQIGGRNRRGEMGYRNVVPCRVPGIGTLMRDIGWTRPGTAPSPRVVIARECYDRCADQLTAPFTALLIPDPTLARRVLPGEANMVPVLAVEEAPGDLQPSVPPSIADIPNNHRAYAVQWFLFAAVAGIVYVLALRRRRG